MLRAIVTAAFAAIVTIGLAQAHSDKPKDAEKKAAPKHAAKGDAKKDHGKTERKH